MNCRILAAAALAATIAASYAADPVPAEPKKSLWDGSVGVGLTLTSGNSDTLMVNGNVQANRKWDRNELNLGADGTYGEDSGTKNAEQARGYGQYNRLFTERVFGYARAEGLHDAIADVDYRFTLSPGAGYYFIKTTNTTLRAELGPGWIYECRDGVTDDYFTLRLAERFDKKLNDTVKLWEALEYLPQVDRFENYIINAEIGIEVALSKKLVERTFFQDTYDSEPAPGRKKNDMKLVFAIGYKF
jgi:putative salt-induced outer membrane protein